VESDIKLKKFLISPKTIISLIILTLIACLIGFLVPQIADKSPSFFETWQEKNIYTYRFVTRLQLNRVYTSYWFMALVVMMATSLSYTLYLQIKRSLLYGREQRIVDKEHSTQRVNEIRNVLGRRRYREQGFLANSNKLIYSKNALGRWGSVIFHLGLLLIILSAVLVLCFQKRGFVPLIEGDVFDGQDSGFLVKNSGLFAGRFNTGFETYLSKLDHTYWENGSSKFLESAVEFKKDTETVKSRVSINNPLLIDGTRIYQSDDYGYALSFILKRPSGEEVVSHFNIDRAANVNKYAVGKTAFPMSPYILEIKFLPDLSRKSFYLKNPIVHLSVYKGLNPVFSGLVPPGNAVKISDDVLYFSGVRYWSGLIFVHNFGVFIAYVGFGVIILGATIMFMLPYKEIHITVHPERQSLDVSGSTKRYNALHKEEINEILEEINIANG
jgi:cytochrome c biogenesis protein